MGDSWTRPWWKTDEAIAEEERLEREQAERRWADKHAEEVARAEKATGRPVREDAERVYIRGLSPEEADEEMARRVAMTRAGDLGRFSDPFVVQKLVSKLNDRDLAGWTWTVGRLVRSGLDALAGTERELAAVSYARNREREQVEERRRRLGAERGEVGLPERVE